MGETASVVLNNKLLLCISKIQFANQ